jgi:DNA polymerase III alpha subunit
MLVNKEYHSLLAVRQHHHPARVTPPDIDTDICSRKRCQLIQFAYDKFGRDRVATVCAITTFKSRSALREVSKAYGLLQKEIGRLTENLPGRWYRAQTNEVDSPYTNLRDDYPDPTHQAIFQDAEYLIALPHHISVHPGGVVVSPGPITDWTPVQTSSKGVTITQLDLNSIERIGLVKIDLLGICGITVLGKLVEKAINDCIGPVSSWTFNGRA